MEQIKKILSKIEVEKQVKILFACETGSRAWGFPSPDSDYDIRFIYVHKRDWYLSLNERKDTIGFMNGDWDLSGWDLRKSLRLLKKSNAPLIERFQSPIVYFEEEGFAAGFKKLIGNCYSPVSVFYHHYSLAKKFWDDLKDEKEFKLKSFFYLVRSMLSCNWIMEDDTVLSMTISGLMEKADDGIRNRLNDLIKIKSLQSEKYLHSRDEILHNWMLALWNKIEKAKDSLKSGNADDKLLNDYFLNQIHEHTDNRTS